MENTGWKQPFHRARRLLAKTWIKFFPHLTIIGITGSYGKTNTVRAITQVLSQKYQVLQTDLNLDTVYNLPLTLLKIRRGLQKLVLEYGVDHKNEMDFHLNLVKPSIGVVTGINPTHSDPDLLGSMDGIIGEKRKLLQALPENGLAVLNWDDANVRLMAGVTKAKIIKYGTTSTADYWADKIKIDFSGTSFTIHYRKESYPIKIGLIGMHLAIDCLAAVAVARHEGLGWQDISRGLAKLKPLPGRLSLESGPRGTTLINDALRANPASTLAGLKVLNELPAKGKRIAVLGEMGELGQSAIKEHQQIGRGVAKLKIDYYVGIGPLQKYATQEAVKAGMARERVYWTADVQAAANEIKSILKPGDLWYLKGSLLRHLERIILSLKNEQVTCRLVSCHRYQSCSTCPRLSGTV